MDQQIRHLLEFGPFRIDVEERILLRDQETIPLSPKAFEMLLVLARHSERVVLKNDLMKTVWPDTFVEESNLSQHIFQLRKALGDNSHDPRYIVTVPGRGYRFEQKVTELSERNGDLLVQTRSKQPVAVEPALPAAPSPQVPVAWRYWKQTTVAVVASLIVAGVFRLGLQSRSGQNPGFNLEKMEITKLTDSGKVESVAISPDGRYVIYALRDRQGLGLWIRQVATHRDVQILPSDANAFEGLSFSPDGAYVYFVRTARNIEDFRYLYVMPLLGGPARLLATDIDSPISFAPDGHRFVYTRGDLPRDLCEVRIANADGSGNRVLASIPGAYADIQPGAAWSPDGHTIAVSFMLYGKRSGFVLDVVTVRDGSVREFYTSSYAIGRPLWLPEGDALLVSLKDRTGRGQLWRISYPEGETRRLTNDLADYNLRIDATRDTGTVAAIQSTSLANIWVATSADLSRGRQITSGGMPVLEVADAPGGKLVAASSAGELFIMNADGSQAAPVDDVHNARTPISCGRYLLFDSSQPGKVGLMRTDADGSHPTLLANGLIWSPVCSTDIESAFYVELSGPGKIWRIPIGGGLPTELATILGVSVESSLTLSPDGKFLAYAFLESTPAPVMKLAVIPVEGGPPARLLQVPGWTYERQCLRWSPDGKALQSLVTRDGATNIWEQSFAGGEPRQLTRFTSGRIFNFNWSADHKNLLLARGDISSDVVLLRNFR